MNTVSTTCDLTGGGTVVFDAPYSEADDQPEQRPNAYELFAGAVGA